MLDFQTSVSPCGALWALQGADRVVIDLGTLRPPSAGDMSGMGPEVRYQSDIEWKMDPVLELWVDVETTPVIVRLVGVLDKLTCTSVVPIIESLLEEGYRDFAMQVDGLEMPDAGGFSSLVAIQRLVKRAGGSLSWSSWPERCISTTMPGKQLAI